MIAFANVGYRDKQRLSTSMRALGRVVGLSGLCGFGMSSGCSIDSRSPLAAVGAGGAAGATNGGSTTNGGQSGASGASGADSTGASGSAGSAGAADAADAMAPEPSDCGAAGQPCCDTAPRCGAGLGCEASSVQCAPCAAFSGIGVPEELVNTFVTGISGDGRVVVGHGENANDTSHAFRSEWALPDGFQALDVLSGAGDSVALAASRDGFAVVGRSNGRGFRWTETGLVDLGVWAEGDTESEAVDVSADGNVVLLTSTGSDGTRLAYRWLNGGGKSPIIGMEEARGISADGNVSVGNRLGAGNEAVVAAPGIQVLGTLPGDSVAFARAISADGTVAVGVSGSCGCRGFRWQGGTMQGTEGLFRALATSGDGAVVGGDSVDATCSGGKAAVWTAQRGARSVACEALPAGIIPSGWSLTLVTAVSDDGRVIAGEGINPELVSEGWVAVLGPDCRAP